MRHLLPALLALALGAPLLAAPTPPQRIIRPGALWEDNNGNHINAHGGGFLRHGGKVWWFGEHKVPGDAGNYAHVGVHCYSSDEHDLVNWKDEGIALRVSDDPASDIAKGCILERPKVIHNAKTGKFVMWFHLEPKGRGYSAARSGVAVADRPEGPYTFLRSGRVNPGKWPENIPADKRTLAGAPKAETLRGSWFPEGMDKAAIFYRDFAGGQMARDMTLFVDDDGKAYHLYASEDNGTLQIAELDDTYTAHTGRYVRAFEGRFMEAPAVFKKDGKYWFVGSGCTGWAPNAARSAVADHILGPWRELGNPARGENANKTHFSQSTYILPHPAKPGAFIYCGDRWTPKNAIDGRYVWLPIEWENGKPILNWKDAWSPADL